MKPLWIRIDRIVDFGTSRCVTPEGFEGNFTAARAQWSP